MPKNSNSSRSLYLKVKYFSALVIITLVSTNLVSCASNPISVNAQERRFSEYLSLLKSYRGALGPLGTSSKSEIEIVLDPVKMKEIEVKTGRIVGIIQNDSFWLLLNDPVKFPNGKTGVYGRLLWKKSIGSNAGVAVMAVTSDGRIALNRNYRHATRSWEYELPRGGIETKETAHNAAIREVKEETGFEIKDLTSLGEMANDSGITSAVTTVFLAKLGLHGKSELEDSEAIAGVELYSLKDISLGIISGYLTFMDGRHETKIPLRDPFLTFGMWQAQARGLLPVVQMNK